MNGSPGLAQGALGVARAAVQTLALPCHLWHVPHLPEAWHWPSALRRKEGAMVGSQLPARWDLGCCWHHLQLCALRGGPCARCVSRGLCKGHNQGPEESRSMPCGPGQVSAARLHLPTGALWPPTGC